MKAKEIWHRTERTGCTLAAGTGGAADLSVLGGCTFTSACAGGASAWNIIPSVEYSDAFAGGMDLGWGSDRKERHTA